MGSIPAIPSTKHASCFPPSSLPASIEISIKLVIYLSVGPAPEDWATCNSDSDSESQVADSLLPESQQLWRPRQTPATRKATAVIPGGAVSAPNVTTPATRQIPTQPYRIPATRGRAIEAVTSQDPVRRRPHRDMEGY
jgi:hypothetical protein